MKLKDTIYESLTDEQRFIAYIEAQARGDEAEQDRLTDTCKWASYREKGGEFREMLNRHYALAVAYECDMRGLMITLLIKLKREGKFCRETLEQMAVMQAEWHKTLQEMGIDLDTQQKAMPFRHHTLELIEGLFPVIQSTY